MSFLRSNPHEGGPTRAEAQYTRLSGVLFPDVIVASVEQGDPLDTRIEDLPGQSESSQHTGTGFGKRVAHALRFVTLGSVEG